MKLIFSEGEKNRYFQTEKDKKNHTTLFFIIGNFVAAKSTNC